MILIYTRADAMVVIEPDVMILHHVAVINTCWRKLFIGKPITLAEFQILETCPASQ